MASVGDTVSFTFTTQGRSSGVRHKHYAEGEVVKVGEKRLSVRVLDDPLKHQYWRDEHAGTIKVISPSRIIPELE
ncbi:hypothetical protein CJ026_009105 [Ralstonia pickettii]|uniref:hypothetical protein n=1 Tax=Ralstonia pickettii TaxID=329 RepID=UPI000BD54D55|nr:hypothetical protein [Ralstonia pickettii]POH87046.1 hypothetical protein CJ026_009105 [Ralstonia pickettii]